MKLALRVVVKMLSATIEAINELSHEGYAADLRDINRDLDRVRTRVRTLADNDELPKERPFTLPLPNEWEVYLGRLK